MTLGKALVYFLREASLNLLRSWKVSLVAVATIAVSLFVGGAFLLLSGNLASVVDQWRRETKVMVYLAPEASAAEAAALAQEARALPWVDGVETVAEEVARERFQRLFPSLSDLVEGGSQEPLPASLEVAFDPRRAEPGAFAAWISGLKARPAVAMVDDDREWLAELSTIVALARGLGLGLGLILLAAAVFTIASVVRLTAYLYHDEIAIMRLVGATEFFIRGPFYAEGLLQGLLGALLAAGSLFAAFHALAPRAAASAWGALILDRFLPPSQLAALVALGAAAGLAGAVASLRREKLVVAEE